MSEPGIAADVDRGLYLVERIEALKKELEQIEVRLTTAGLEGEQIELVDPEREGRQFLAKGSEAIVPVVFTADLLVKSFAAHSAVHDKIDAALADPGFQRPSFFARFTIYKTAIDSGKIFRARAAEILGEAAPAFISACLQRDKHGIPKSQVKIEWGRAEKIAAPNEGADADKVAMAIHKEDE